MTTAQTTAVRYHHSDGVLTRETGDGLLVLLPGARELICLTGTARVLWDCLRSPRSEGDAADLLADMYGAPRDVVGRDLAPVLADLVGRGALLRSDERP